MSGFIEKVRREVAYQIFKVRGRRAKFEEIHRRNLFGSEESASGVGSTLAATANVAGRLEALVRELGVTSVLDAPCGDFHWMRGVDLGAGVRYVGADIVRTLVERNRELYGGHGREFILRDIVAEPLPAADLVLCRDCLVHLSFRDGLAAVANFRRSGSTWLLATTFPAEDANRDIVTGQWRPLNLCAPPFGFPPPERVIAEDAADGAEGHPDKSLGLWRLRDLPGPAGRRPGSVPA